jgi:hypothetical protein
MGCVDEALEALRQPVIPPGLPPLAVHALLHHDPAPVIRNDEGMQIEVESVLDGSAVDLCDQTAHPGERPSIQADTLADRG